MRTRSRRLPISAVVPAFEAEADIRAALESIMRQSRPPAEIVVVDDASPDRTAEIAAEYGARVIRFAHNAGPSAARNAGVTAARQPWIAFLDADDVWQTDKLAAQWAALQRWPDAGFCFTDYDVVDTSGHFRAREMSDDSGYMLVPASKRHGYAVQFERGALLPGLVASMFVRQSSVIVQRGLFLRTGGYDTTLRLSEDYDLLLRLAGATSAVAIERPLVTYQRRATSLSGDPLAEIASIDRLWSSILARPDRYPPAVAAMIARRRPATLQRGCRTALRLGRFSEAIPLAREALRSEPSTAALLLLGCSLLCDNQPGRAAFRAARSLWRSRPKSAVLRHPGVSPLG